MRLLTLPLAIRHQGLLARGENGGALRLVELHELEIGLVLDSLALGLGPELGALRRQTLSLPGYLGS